MTLTKLTGRVINHGKDELGRYVWQEIRLNGERTLLIITAYRIPQDSVTGCGPETSAMQQWRKLRNKGIEIPKPRQQALDDLATFATAYESLGNEVIIMMDANSPANDPDLTAFTDSLNLHDLMADYLPDIPPKTYQRG
jgi:L-alanine-DL-glutamate epimerase-like enolase superfamily enzyme